MSDNFGEAEVTRGATLTKCGLWADMVDVITCAFGDCPLRVCEFGKRGKFALSHWLEVSLLQHRVNLSLSVYHRAQDATIYCDKSHVGITVH